MPMAILSDVSKPVDGGLVVAATAAVEEDVADEVNALAAAGRCTWSIEGSCSSPEAN